MTKPHRRVLCAESNEDICYIVSTMLRHEGHEVLTARTARECIESARAGGFDLYVLDDYYADGDGLDLCRRLREMTPQTPILFFSAHSREQDRSQAVRQGATHYLIQPDDIFEVVRTVNSILAPQLETVR